MRVGGESQNPGEKEISVPAGGTPAVFGSVARGAAGFVAGFLALTLQERARRLARHSHGSEGAERAAAGSPGLQTALLVLFWWLLLVEPRADE